jgi:6-phospho-beta-glucosidase
MGIDIAVIGAGSTYTPEIIEGLAARSGKFAIDSIRLMDIDAAKLGIVGGLARRMVDRAGSEGGLEPRVDMPRVVLTLDLDEALSGADYVLAQVRVGRLAARIKDESVPLKHGLIGQETTGIGGFFKGLRTIPVVLDIARRMERLCPGAWLVNFSNPSGMVAQALLSESRIRTVGLCNNAINMYRAVAKWLGRGKQASAQQI